MLIKQLLTHHPAPQKYGNSVQKHSGFLTGLSANALHTGDWPCSIDVKWGHNIGQG